MNAKNMPAVHHKVWPRRAPHSITVPSTSLWDSLDTTARRYPGKVATEFLGQTMTYAELRDQAERVAGSLAKLGVRTGDRVILLMQNCPQLVVAHWGILRANAVVVPVNPMNKVEELRHYITDPDVRVAITTADLAPLLLEASNTLPADQQLAHLLVTRFTDAFDADAASEMDLPASWLPWLTSQPALPPSATQVHHWVDMLAAQYPAPVHTAGPDDLAVLPYTSGTTGLPKGCMHTHATILHNVVAAAAWAVSSADHVILVVVPMFHITGLVMVLQAGTRAGCTMVIMPRWDRDVAGRLISQWRVTTWTNIPTMVIDLLGSPKFDQYDLSSLTYIGGGGAAMPAAVAQKLWDLYGLRYVEGYGLTETAAPSHSNPPDAPKQQCLGIPYMGVDARVVDPQSLQELPAGEAGEIWIHGPSVFKGYWKNPEATAQAFVQMDGKSFFRSGDMGRVDEEGYFFITDRLKRMINSSGFKVWPAEVEALMFRHPAIQEACVIAKHDPYRGESAMAVVVRRAGANDVDEAAVIAWCKDNMAAYKVPRFVKFVDALPKSGSGKVMWRVLQEAEKVKSKN
ncbi:MAG: hypothetical protein RLZZ126_349 [Pseudomonadota bacterium]|jgi:fatty-acyl-CoA synthase